MTTGSLGCGCRNWSNASRLRVRLPIGHARGGPMPTRGRSAWKLRTRSCGSARPSPNEAWTQARKPSLRTWPPSGWTAVPATSTIWRILSRRGFVTPQPQKRPRSSWRRFCADQPNERWQADITHWRLADGSEVEILNILDDHSRVCIASTARPIFTGTRRVARSFSPHSRRWNLPAERAHRQRCRLHREATRRRPGRSRGRSSDCAASGLSHSRPYHPQTCGKVERFHQTQKKWLAAQPPRRHAGRAATPARPVLQLLQHRPAAPSARPPHPRPGLCAPDPKPSRPSPIIPAHYRVRHDKIDPGGSVTLRHNSRLHHIGLGTRLAGTPVTLLIDDLHIRVISATPAADPRTDPGPDPELPAPRATTRPTQTDRSHTPGGIPIQAQPRHRSRGQGWPQATRRAPALTPARTAPPSQPGCRTPPEMQRCPETPANGVPRHHIVRREGIEPPTR